MISTFWAILLLRLQAFEAFSDDLADYSVNACSAAADCATRAKSGLGLLQKKLAPVDAPRVSTLAEDGIAFTATAMVVNGSGSMKSNSAIRMDKPPLNLAAVDMSGKLSDEQLQLMCYLKQRVPISLRTSKKQTLRRFQTCAVVSNSGSLRSHTHGSSIDTAEAVIRFNYGKTAGFERMVGSRTTVRLLTNYAYAAHAHKLPESPSYVWMDKPSSSPAELNKSTVFFFSGVRPHETLSHALTDLYGGAWWRKGEHNGKSFDPTTGAKGMLTAMTFCKKVVAYDMTVSRASETAHAHYFEVPRSGNASDDSAVDNAWHKTMEAEHDLWRRLSVADPEQDFEKGIATLLGFPSISCGNIGSPNRISLQNTGIVTARRPPVVP